MRTSAKGVALIKQFEGFRPRLYKDAASLLTIGYGHLVAFDDVDYFANGIDEAEALALLSHDLGRAERAVRRFITAPLTQGQFDALVSFTFNLGGGSLQRSTLRRVVNREEHDAVPAQMMRFVWAAGRKLPGLIRRRQAEARLYQS